MSQVQCRVALSAGRWQTEPTLAAVRNILAFYFGNALEEVVIAEDEPEPTPDILRLEVTAYTGYGFGHAEAVRDRIVVALLRRFQPEFESMVEVEELDEESEE